MGWLRIVGSIKLYVSFCTRYSSILQHTKRYNDVGMKVIVFKSAKGDVPTSSTLFCRITSLFYRALLQTRPIIVSILLAKATPYLPENLRVFGHFVVGPNSKM